MTGNTLVDRIILAVNVLFILLAAGLVGYSHLGIKKVPTNQPEEFETLKESAISSSQMSSVKFKKITVNLVCTPRRLRYLDVELNVLPFEENQKQKILDSEHLFKNSLISIADTMTHEEVATMTGKILLESRLRKQVNLSLGGPVVKQIYFSTFVIQ